MSKAITLDNLKTFKNECDKIYALKSDIPVTDELLGTWVFNDSINIIDENLSDYNITFKSNNKSFTLLQLEKNKLNYGMRYNTDYAWSDDHENNGWWNTAYKTITITDTSSLTNREEFTTWLKENATKQEESSGSGGGGLKGYSLTINNTVDATINLLLIDINDKITNVSINYTQKLTYENIRKFILLESQTYNLIKGIVLSYNELIEYKGANETLQSKISYELLAESEFNIGSGGGTGN